MPRFSNTSPIPQSIYASEGLLQLFSTYYFFFFKAATCIPPDISVNIPSVKTEIPPLDSPHHEHSSKLLNLTFALFSRLLLYTFTLEQKLRLFISYVYLNYRYAISKSICELYSPHDEHSFELLNVPFALIPRSLLSTFILGLILECLTISCEYSSSRNAMIKEIPWLDSPHWQCPFELFNILFVLFSRSLLHTFILGCIFEPLSI